MPRHRNYVCPGCQRATTEKTKDTLCARCITAANTPAKCAECGNDCKKVTGADIYTDPSLSHMAKRVFWKCDCGAYVGSHEGSGAPLGTAAGPELRSLRSQTHTYFDKLWRHFVVQEGWLKHIARATLYGWLAGRLGIRPNECHIALFDDRMCHRAIEVCQTYHFPDTPITSQ